MTRLQTHFTHALIRTVGALSRVEWLVVAALMATGAAVYFKEDLLSRSLTATSSKHQQQATAYYYGDEGNGGTSVAWPRADGQLGWSCTVTLAFSYPYCGFGYQLGEAPDKGFDLSDYDRVRLTVNVAGETRFLRVYLRNYNDAYSNLADRRTNKYNYYDAAVVEGRQEIEIPLAQFAVADWWKAASKIPAKLSRPEFTNIVAFDAQIGMDGQTGQHHIRFDSIQFEKRILTDEEFYSLLAFIWTGLVLWLLGRWRRLVRLHEQQELKSIKWASEHDALTNLPNRRAFDERLEAAVSRASKSGSTFALLLVDLDYFKHVNDSLGHPAGDELLKVVAKRLTGTLDKNAFVARIGGDEFAILVESFDERHVRSVGERICELLKTPVQLGERAAVAGASIGAAIFPRDGRCASDLVNSADIALYALKQEGRGGTRLIDEEIVREARRTAAQLDAARLTINENGVRPHYQPIVSLATRDVIGFEALMRCDGPGELQSTSILHEAFADYDLSSRLAQLMHHQIAHDIAAWNKSGLLIGRVAINAAPAEFLRDDYAERLLATLSKAGVSSSQITVEVTEQVFLGRSKEYVARAVRVLKAADVLIALDDFGTGYSSLSHLLDVQVDCVKLDKTFIDKVSGGGDALSIVAAVVSLAKSLKIETVAEGIETEAQFELLRSLGCDQGQGYLFGKAGEASLVGRSLQRLPKVA